MSPVAVVPVRVVLPAHLKNLARVGGEVTIPVPAGSGPVTRAALLDALEAAYPVLAGTIRDQATGERRAFIRFYACSADLSREPADAPLPPEVRDGREPFLVIGAMAGG